MSKHTTIRLEPAKKEEFSKICDSMGLTVSGTINVFVNKVLQTRRIPFEITADDDLWASWRNPVSGVAVILMDGAKIALVKRSGGEKWSIPCGCIEYGENFVDAATREVKEEIGIDCEPLKIINVVSNNWTSSSTLAAIGSSVAIVIAAKPLSLGLVADGVETTEAKWFDVTEPLPEIEFDADRYIIKKLKECCLSQTEISGIFLSERQTNFTQT